MVVDVHDIFTSSEIFEAGFELLSEFTNLGVLSEMRLVFLRDANEGVAQGIRFKDFHSCLEGLCTLRFIPRSLEFLRSEQVIAYPKSGGGLRRQTKRQERWPE